MSYFTDARGDVNPFRIIAVMAVVLIGFAILVGSFGTVGAGERGVKTRFGEVVSVHQPGPYFKVPFADAMHKIDVKTQTVVYELENPLFAASKDLQDVDVATVINYRIDPAIVDEVYQQYGSVEAYESDIIRPAIRDTVKTAASGFTAEDLVKMRNDYVSSTSVMLSQRLESFSVQVERVNITNIRFSRSYTESIEAKVTAEQNALKAENDLARVQFEAQQTVEQAKAEAEAIRIKASAITQQGGKDYVDLQRIERWNGQGCTSYCGLETSTGLLIQR